MKDRKLKSLLHKSNTFNYGQLLLNNVVILTIKSNLFKSKDFLLKVEIFEKLYNNKIISYTTLIFFLNKEKKIVGAKSNFSFLKILTELGGESGILLENKKECKNIIFYGK